MASAKSRGAQTRSAAFGYANLLPFVFFALFPFYFMFVTSFKSNAELYNLKSIPFWVQTGVIADHYTFLFQKTEFLTWMKNSLLISVVATTVSVPPSRRLLAMSLGRNCTLVQKYAKKYTKAT